MNSALPSGAERMRCQMPRWRSNSSTMPASMPANRMNCTVMPAKECAIAVVGDVLARLHGRGADVVGNAELESAARGGAPPARRRTSPGPAVRSSALPSRSSVFQFIAIRVSRALLFQGLREAVRRLAAGHAGQ